MILIQKWSRWCEKALASSKKKNGKMHELNLVELDDNLPDMAVGVKQHISTNSSQQNKQDGKKPFGI